MTNLTQKTLLSGSDEPLPEMFLLRAGPLSVVFDNGDLRYIRLGEHEILRRVYAAVRDHNWGTVPSQLSNVQIDAEDDHFCITYDALHQQGDIDFLWHGIITGESAGTIVFEFDGQARSTFRRNRIGFCVLHPMDLAGQACVVTHVDQGTTAGAFPQHISPHQPFFNIRAITHEVVPGVHAEVLMEGDTFEMEDQRNWTDASYKTYCTPLGLPFPATVEAGTRIEQRITVRLLGDVPGQEQVATEQPLTVTVMDDSTPLPRLGLEVASHGEPLTPTEADRLHALNLAHLRVVLSLDEDGVDAVLHQAAEQARSISVPLEIALWLSENAAQELSDLRALLDKHQPPVCRWLVYRRNEPVTSADVIQLARVHLASYDPMAPIGGGTDAFFTELNRNRPAASLMDFVSFSVNPQVHAFANIDLVETLAAQAAVVESTRAFTNGLPVVVSPVTFHMRWNPNATGAQPSTPPGELPRRVDPRQMSIFGAGWTMGSIKYLVQSGAHSVTYFETTGWLGVMERPGGSELPEKFPSVPGGVFPMYHVFAAVGDFADGAVRHSQSSEPLVVDALALITGRRTRVLLANYTADKQRVTLRGLSGDLLVKSLDAHNVEGAMRDPASWQDAKGDPLRPMAGAVLLELNPFALVQIDLNDAG